MKEIKERLLIGTNTSFQKTQFNIVTLPDWNENMYKDGLRSLLSKAEWITDQENHLIFTPFIDCLIYSLHVSGKKKFERERKYILFYMEEDKKNSEQVLVHIIHFVMLNSKELSAVSMKLAAGDLLLTPVIKSDKVFTLPYLRNIIFDKVDQMFPEHLFLTDVETAPTNGPEVLEKIDVIKGIMNALDGIYRDVMYYSHVLTGEDSY